MMKAYIVRHHTDGYDFGENVLVYHYTEEAAQELGRHCLTSESSWESTFAERAPEHDSRCVSMTEPEQEEDEEYLREKGWRYEGEKTCDSCGLAAFGQEEYAVCNECGMCKECGCDTVCQQSEDWSCEGVRKSASPMPSLPTSEPPLTPSEGGS